MPKFKLSIDIITESNEFKVLITENIEGESLVEVLSKLPLMVLKMKEKLELDKWIENDDIPF